MSVLCGARVVTPTGVIDGGWVQVEARVITAVGSGTPPGGGTADLGGAWLLPGYIDLHVHGGGGYDASASPADMAAAVAFHRSHGTTRTLVSLMTAPLDALAEQLGWIADRAALGPTPDGYVVGAHLEGPFLSPVRSGAQNPQFLQLPDRGAFSGLLAAARGCLRSVTLAPELPGALDLIVDIVGAGAVAAIGHTDRTYTDARAAIETGARLATHLFNGTRALHHREPGVIGAALASDLACEVINDGIHVHRDHDARRREHLSGSCLSLTRSRRPVSATVSSPSEASRCRFAAVRLGSTSTGALAGSTLTMDDAVRRAVLDCGLPIEVASAAVSANPARVLGIDDSCGRSSPGTHADLVVLDDGPPHRRGSWPPEFGAIRIGPPPFR